MLASLSLTLTLVLEQKNTDGEMPPFMPIQSSMSSSFDRFLPLALALSLPEAASAKLSEILPSLPNASSPSIGL